MVHQCNDLMTRKAVMSDTSTEYRKPGKYLLDSTFFVAFELAHEGLKEGLREASCLNCTQYRVLVIKTLINKGFMVSYFLIY